MLDPVDVLAKLPDNFKEGVESKKWLERRDALQTLLTLCTDNPKLDPKANYGEHVAILNKVSSSLFLSCGFLLFFFSEDLCKSIRSWLVGNLADQTWADKIISAPVWS
ncbi:unnamed protein product [Toxocara canis]|uniref:WHIM1 domain-containing protein n=1 Tax=Toxocara canis TaxID=6265 RepID=A0A183U228_TOXCA|nr:unnamed protein product [Toxocara canis]